MILAVLVHAPALSFSPLWIVPVLILAFPLIAPAPKPTEATKATIKKFAVALVIALALSAVAIYAEDDATTDVLTRMHCSSKWLLEIFGICL